MIQRFQRKCKEGQSLYHTSGNGYVTRGVIVGVNEDLISIWWAERFSQEYFHNDLIWQHITLCCTTEAI